MLARACNMQANVYVYAYMHHGAHNQELVESQ